MRNRNLFASVLLACSLAVGFLVIAPVADAESRERSFLKRGESAKKSARNSDIELKRRVRGRRIHLPIGPSYIYYDYPYYYSRGYYPTHIGGYVYYPYHYYYRSYHPRYRGSPRRQKAHRN